MSRIYFLISLGALFLLSAGLAACSTLSAPRQIATYPRSTPYSQLRTGLVYDTYLELEVPDVDEAVDRAIMLAYQAGGWHVDSPSWQQGMYNQTTIVLAVPADHFEAFYWSLLRLGTPIDEELSSRETYWPAEGPGAYAYFTVHFQPGHQALPYFPHAGWRPLETLEKAWRLSVSILGFLVDALIWVAVILGPFILIGVGTWVVIRRFRSKPVNKM